MRALNAAAFMVFALAFFRIGMGVFFLQLGVTPEVRAEGWPNITLGIYLIIIGLVITGLKTMLRQMLGLLNEQRKLLAGKTERG